MNAEKGLAAFLFLFLAANVLAQNPPPLNQQDAWTADDKKAFLRYLNSNAPAPSGQVKEVSPPPGTRSGRSYAHKARYLTLEVLSDTVFPIDPSNHGTSLPAAFGGRIVAGGHLFTWVRYYAGAQVAQIKQKRLDGATARLSHLMVPAGLEFALIPLGTPQTRYVLLRGGVAVNNFSGPGTKSDFAAPLLGTTLAWTLGLGYEAQVPNSPWRLHVLAESYKSIRKKEGVGYYGAGVTAGLARTF